MTIHTKTESTDLTICELRGAIRRGETNPEEVLHAYLERLREVEPLVKSWAYLDESGCESAAVKATARLRSGAAPRALEGVPVGVKDIYDVAGMPTRAGSRVRQEEPPAGSDAGAVERLRRAGALVIGKTTTTEFASRGHIPSTRNPWNLEHSPGGSSGGSGAALAARTALVTLGSQTRGSLLRPAAYNGLTALKASQGQVPRSGMLPVSWSLDHAGAMTRTAEDAARVHAVLTDATPVDDGVRELLAVAVPGLRVAVPDRYFTEVDAASGEAFQRALEVLIELGVQVKQVRLPDSFEPAMAAVELVVRAEAASVHQDLFATSAQLYGAGLRSMLSQGLQISAVDYLRAQRLRTDYAADLRQMFSNVDVLATPTTPSPAPRGLADTGSPVFNTPFNASGTPSLTVPMGYVGPRELPVGLQLAAAHKQEATILSLGHAYQQVTYWHRRFPSL